MVIGYYGQEIKKLKVKSTAASDDTSLDGFRASRMPAAAGCHATGWEDNVNRLKTNEKCKWLDENDPFPKTADRNHSRSACLACPHVQSHRQLCCHYNHFSPHCDLFCYRPDQRSTTEG